MTSNAESSFCPCPPTADALDSHRPLPTRADLDERVRQLVPCAIQRQLWLLLFDADDVQMPVMLPIGELPVLPGDLGGGIDGGLNGERGRRDAGDEGLGDMLASLHREFTVGSFVFVLERPGSPELDSDDVEWLAFCLRVGERSGVRVRAAYLCHSSGHGGFDRDDVDTSALRAGLRVPSHAERCRTCPVAEAAVSPDLARVG